jgi:hypothetical protein
MHQELTKLPPIHRIVEKGAMRCILASIFCFALLSCDGPPEATNPPASISLSARIERLSNVTDSVWTSAAAVHVHLATTNGSPLLDDTVLFLEHHVPKVSAPIDKGIVATIDGLNDALAVVWSGSTTLPPGEHDTTFRVTVGVVDLSRAGQGPSGSDGTMNTPSLDSTDIAPWKANTYGRPVRIYLSSITPGAVIHYTLDGSSPMAFTPTYNDSGILIESTRTLKSVAIRSGWTNSAVLTLPIVVQAPY